MKKAKHIGNVTLIIDGKIGDPDSRLLLGLKRPRNKKDEKRRRKKVGSGRWVPPGGATEMVDKSQKHGAKREVWQETGLSLPLKAFKKAGQLLSHVLPSRKSLWLVHIYVVEMNGLRGDLILNEEYVDMRWFPVTKLPFSKMLRGDRDWIPRIIRGEKVSVKLHFDDTDDVVASEIRTIGSFN